jgi:hypothetical protein
MHEELENLERNQVWELVDPPPGCKPIGTKWVWKNKEGEKGHVVERRNFHSFSNHVQSDNEDVIGTSWSYILLPLHMSTILYLLILDIPTYRLILMIIGFER